SAEVRGTVAAAASDVPRASAMEYRPVIGPTRSGNQLLITTGIRTLPTAIPARASALAARKPAVPPANGRTATPAAIATIPPQTMAPGPNRLASRGAAIPKTAKHRDGTDVSRPATVPLIPRPSRTSSRSAPRLVMAGRRLSAARTIPAITIRGSQRAPPPPGRAAPEAVAPAVSLVSSLVSRGRGAVAGPAGGP